MLLPNIFLTFLFRKSSTYLFFFCFVLVPSSINRHFPSTIAYEITIKIVTTNKKKLFFMNCLQFLFSFHSFFFFAAMNQFHLISIFNCIWEAKNKSSAQPIHYLLFFFHLYRYNKTKNIATSIIMHILWQLSFRVGRKCDRSKFIERMQFSKF